MTNKRVVLRGIQIIIFAHIIGWAIEKAAIDSEELNGHYDILSEVGMNHRLLDDYNERKPDTISFHRKLISEEIRLVNAMVSMINNQVSIKVPYYAPEMSYLEFDNSIQMKFKENEEWITSRFKQIENENQRHRSNSNTILLSLIGFLLLNLILSKIWKSA